MEWLFSVCHTQHATKHITAPQSHFCPCMWSGLVYDNPTKSHFSPCMCSRVELRMHRFLCNQLTVIFYSPSSAPSLCASSSSSSSSSCLPSSPFCLVLPCSALPDPFTSAADAMEEYIPNSNPFLTLPVVDAVHLSPDALSISSARTPSHEVFGGDCVYRGLPFRPVAFYVVFIPLACFCHVSHDKMHRSLSFIQLCVDL